MPSSQGRRNSEEDGLKSTKSRSLARMAGTEDGNAELLRAARNGELEVVRSLLDRSAENEILLNMDCKGSNKANKGWSPLHLAAYFGHKDVVHLLLEYGANVNIVNDVGDTPLHRAAHTGRLELVLLLLQYDADTRAMNDEGLTAKVLARNQEIKRVIEGAETVGVKRAEQQFLRAAREGDTVLLDKLLKGPKRVTINCSDEFGNTALHAASYRDQREVAVLLLQNGIDTTIQNKKGQTALALAKDTRMRQLLDVKPVRELQRGAQRHEGPLLKRSKLLGWKACWAVLERGVISFFRTRGDASTGTRRKTYKYLDGARVEAKEDAGHVFLVHLSDSTILMLAVEPDGTARVQRQRWQNAVSDHIAFTDHYTRRDTDTDDEDMNDILPLGSMEDVLQSAAANQQLLESQVQHTNSAISGLIDNAESTNKEVSLLQVRLELAQIVETSQEMAASLSHCLNLMKQQEEVRKLQLAQEMEKSRVLQDALHVLAEEHHDLEQSLGGHRSPSALLDETDLGDDDDEFFDCDNDDVTGQSFTSLKHLEEQEDSDSATYEDTRSFTSVPSDASLSNRRQDSSPETTSNHRNSSIVACPFRGRTRLPVPMFSRNDFSIWSILKQCIGKELSKITMPVIFNEPLSFLQRIVEYLEYATLLRKAAQCDDPVRRLEYVAAFAVSATASNWERVGKPFNPLLGETYELVREDLGFRIVTEQVSHHPPVSAFHADSPDYIFRGAIHPKLKFWGKSVEVTPKGIVTLELLKHGEVYTWQNVNCCVHNIIVGKLWIELYGTMEVMNHKTKQKAVLNFKPSGWLGKDLHKVEGHIYDENKKKLRSIYGKWVEALYSYDVDTWEAYCRGSNREPIAEGEVPGKGSTCNLHLPNQRLLWLAHERSEDSSLYYNFSLFAMMLNEINDAILSNCPRTDARLRPDIRKLEEGDIDGAGSEKHRLEEKQRAARKERKKRKEEWKPRWFRQDVNPYTGKEDWHFNKEYWYHKWEGCPDIF